MGMTVCVLQCLHPEQGEGKASAAVEAAFQVAGSGVGGDVCGEELSTPKGTESENQPFSSSHPDPLCVPSALQVPAPPRSLLFPAGEDQSAANLRSPPHAHMSLQLVLGLMNPKERCPERVRGKKGALAAHA